MAFVLRCWLLLAVLVSASACTPGSQPCVFDPFGHENQVGVNDQFQFHVDSSAARALAGGVGAQMPINAGERVTLTKSKEKKCRKPYGVCGPDDEKALRVSLTNSQEGKGLWVPYLPGHATWAFATPETKWMGSGPFSGCKTVFFHEMGNKKKIGMAHLPRSGDEADATIEKKFKDLVQEKGWILLSEPYKVAVPAMKIAPPFEDKAANGHSYNRAVAGDPPQYYTVSHVFIALPDIQNDGGMVAHQKILSSGLRVNLVSQSMGPDSGHVYESKNLFDVQKPAPKITLPVRKY